MLHLVWPLPISLATTFGISVDYFSSPYLDVSVQAVPHTCLFDSTCADRITPAGFPHSDIPGSQLICSSPRLFAAYHVLRRLLMPRHSPCALLRLTFPNHAPAPPDPDSASLLLPQYLQALADQSISGFSSSSSSKNYAGSFFVSLLAKLSFTLNFCFLYCCLFLIVSHSLCVQFSRCILSLLARWWAKVDSNHRPHDYQSCALAS